ncbi:MAG: hypothetical protein K0R12_1115 [Gammaproteobacteria bacterium]|jgi:hypothetical protein|nr:hypothetical protein [Gammaproteobacteria bacterium]
MLVSIASNGLAIFAGSYFYNYISQQEAVMFDTSGFPLKLSEKEKNYLLFDKINKNFSDVSGEEREIIDIICQNIKEKEEFGENDIESYTAILAVYFLRNVKFNFEDYLLILFHSFYQEDKSIFVFQRLIERFLDKVKEYCPPDAIDVAKLDVQYKIQSYQNQLIMNFLITDQAVIKIDLILKKLASLIENKSFRKSVGDNIITEAFYGSINYCILDGSLDIEMIRDIQEDLSVTVYGNVAMEEETRQLHSALLQKLNQFLSKWVNREDAVNICEKIMSRVNIELISLGETDSYDNVIRYFEENKYFFSCLQADEIQKIFDKYERKQSNRRLIELQENIQELSQDIDNKYYEIDGLSEKVRGLFQKLFKLRSGFSNETNLFKDMVDFLFEKEDLSSSKENAEVKASFNEKFRPILSTYLKNPENGEKDVCADETLKKLDDLLDEIMSVLYEGCVEYCEASRIYDDIIIKLNEIISKEEYQELPSEAIQGAFSNFGAFSNRNSGSSDLENSSDQLTSDESEESSEEADDSEEMCPLAYGA